MSNSDGVHMSVEEHKALVRRFYAVWDHTKVLNYGDDLDEWGPSSE